MLAETSQSIKVAIQSISAIVALLVNSLLIYLIVTKSSPKMGTYRHLMIFFCGCSIFFSSMDIIVQPNIHSYKSSFYMVMDIKERKLEPWIGQILICMMCGCFGVTIYGIAIHFIYRYFALERHGRIRYFKEKYLVIWFSIPILGGIGWFTVCYTAFKMEPSKSEILRETTREFFGLEIENTAYAASLFYPPNADGTEGVDWNSFIGFAAFMMLLAIPFGVVLVVGVKSWTKIRELLEHGDSAFAKHLQMQLYRALVAQSAIPLLLLFLPFGVIFICPLFEIDCQFLSVPITIIYAIYPAVDPLPILYFVESYRNAISDFLARLCCCQPTKRQSASVDPPTC